MQVHRDSLEAPPTSPSWLGGSADDRRFVYAVARRIVRDDATASDVAQEALLQAYRHRDRFRGDASHRTWLYRIATTTAISHLRRERAWRRKLDAVMAETVASGAPPGVTATAIPSDALDDARRAAWLAGHVAGLDDKYRRVVELRFRDGLSERETATALGLSTATVKIRAFRARNMLRARLGVDARGTVQAA